MRYQAAELVRFGGSELEHEVVWEAGEVALDRLVQGASLHTVKRGKIVIEHDPLPADVNGKRVNP